MCPVPDSSDENPVRLLIGVLVLVLIIIRLFEPLSGANEMETRDWDYRERTNLQERLTGLANLFARLLVDVLLADVSSPLLDERFVQ